MNVVTRLNQTPLTLIPCSELERICLFAHPESVWMCDANRTDLQVLNLPAGGVQQGNSKKVAWPHACKLVWMENLNSSKESMFYIQAGDSVHLDPAPALSVQFLEMGGSVQRKPPRNLQRWCWEEAQYNYFQQLKCTLFIWFFSCPTSML